MKTTETGGIKILIDSKQFESLLENGVSIVVDSIQTTTTTKEKTMKTERMTLIENVEILSNVAQKTLAYTIAFQGKQHTISLEKATELQNSDFIKNIIGDFHPIQGAKIAYDNNYGLPRVWFFAEVGVSFASHLPEVMLKYDKPTKKQFVEWVQAFNKFLDDIDALNIENVEVPTFKNIVLV